VAEPLGKILARQVAGGYLPPGMRPSGQMTSRKRSPMERVNDLLAANWYGDNREGYQKASRLTNVAQTLAPPVAAAEMMYDAGGEAGRGNYGAAGITLGMAGLPLPGALKKKILPEIRPSSDDVYETLSANFLHGDVVGNKTLPISKVFGSGTAQTADQLARVDDLAAKINSPDGYVSRLIVDTDGNVIEGQHRLEALKKLGFDKVPVTVIRDKAKGFDTLKVEEAIRASQATHPDHVNQIVSQILDMVSEAGSPQKALAEFIFPRSFKAQFEAGLNAMAKAKK